MNKKLFSIRILDFEGSDVLFYNNANKEKGLITKEYKYPLFTNFLNPSLELLYLLNEGFLSIKEKNGEKYSKDIVRIHFNYKIHKIDKESVDVAERVRELRTKLYHEGFKIDGIQYVRYKRSSGAARESTCLFIRKNLFNKARVWSDLGLEKKDINKADLVSFESYKSLSLSSIEDYFDFDVRNILFVKDCKVKLKDKVMCVDYVNNKLEVKEKESEISNIIWDGEGLLDESIFDSLKDYKDKSMLLLRNRFFKACVFNTDLSGWFKKNNLVGKVDPNKIDGFTLAENYKDIKMVITESCLKYLKFKGGYNIEAIKEWCKKVSNRNNLSTFGIVKTDKPTRFFNGDFVETTSQFLNTVNLKERTTKALIAPYFEYIKKIGDPMVTPEFLYNYINGSHNIRNSIEDINYDINEEREYSYADTDNVDLYNYHFKVAEELLKLNKDSIRIRLLKEGMLDTIVAGFALKLYKGRALVKGTNATLFGNPYELLLDIVKKFDRNNPKSVILKKDQISCTAFNNRQTIAGQRSPHVTMANILLAKNVLDARIATYFRLNNEVVVVDAISNNIQFRLTGADYDSDSILLTDNKWLIEAISERYNDFLVPVQNFFSVPIKYDISTKESTLDSLATIDSEIGGNNRNIGSVSNFASKLNAYYWHLYNKNKKDYKLKEIIKDLSKLAILSNVAIDSAKRNFKVKVGEELFKIKSKYPDVREDRSLLCLPHKGVDVNWESGRCEDLARNHFEESYKVTMNYIWDNVCHTPLQPKRMRRLEFNDIFIKHKKIPSGGSAYTKEKRLYQKLVKFIKDTDAKKRIIKKNKYSYNDAITKMFSNNLSDLFHGIQKGIYDKDNFLHLIYNLSKKTSKIHDKENNKNKYVSLSYKILFTLLYLIITYPKAFNFSLKDIVVKGKKCKNIKLVNKDQNPDYSLFDNQVFYKII